MRPDPGKRLFETLFLNRRPEIILRVISKGLIAFFRNATRLIQDAKILINAERFATSRFLITTADEEIAKSYILLDACRLDLERHTSTFQSLCHSFYDHIAKYAYNQIANRMPSLHDMADLKEIWDAETTKWWPSAHHEDGEPDMPHDTYFIRELPLYVDFNDYSEEWYDPEKEAASRYRLVDKYNFPNTEKALERLQRTFQAGLYAPESLAILNDNFKKLYISDRTSPKEIQGLYEKTAQQMESKRGIEKKTFFESALHEWPLYHFTTLRKY
jgi:AbiV family abortive infection protein